MSFMKGLYIIWPETNFNYIEKTINSGIDHLIVAMTCFEPQDDLLYQHIGTYKEVIPILERYHKDPRVKIIFNPVFNTHFRDLPENQSFFDGKKFFKRTPCPTSKEWITDRLSKIQQICETYGIKDIIFDMEHYCSENPEILNIGNDVNEPKYTCKCGRCKTISKDNQWRIHNSVFKHELEKFHNNTGLSITGQMPYCYYWNYKKYIGKKWLFYEKTYPIDKPSKSLFKKQMWSIYEKKARMKFSYRENFYICAGAWIERFTAKDYIDYLYYLGRQLVYDGYWIYAQVRLNQNHEFGSFDGDEQKYPPFYHNLIDDPNHSSGDVNFFENLKKINDKIDKYRSGFLFRTAKNLLEKIV